MYELLLKTNIKVYDYFELAADGDFIFLFAKFRGTKEEENYLRSLPWVFINYIQIAGGKDKFVNTEK